MASKGFCSVLEFGKLSWPNILDFETYLRQVDPELSKAKQEELAMNDVLDRFRNAK